jgi:hypothetical protein
MGFKIGNVLLRFYSCLQNVYVPYFLSGKKDN